MLVQHGVDVGDGAVSHGGVAVAQAVHRLCYALQLLIEA